MKAYLYGYDSEENSYLVSGYPWGWRLKTEVRYWVETNDKARGGQRFCKQTKNPKTGLWCKAKKGTYADITFMYLDTEAHVKNEQIHCYNQDEYDFKEVYKGHKENLSEYQIKKIKWFMARNEVMEHVTVTFKAKDPFCISKFNSAKPEDREEIQALIDEEEKHKKEQTKIKQQICRAVENKASRMNLN